MCVCVCVNINTIAEGGFAHSPNSFFISAGVVSRTLPNLPSFPSATNCFFLRALESVVKRKHTMVLD